MSQDRTVGLAQISIENDIASSIDFSSFIDDFANMKARKVRFIQHSCVDSIQIFKIIAFLLQ